MASCFPSGTFTAVQQGNSKRIGDHWSFYFAAFHAQGFLKFDSEDKDVLYYYNDKPSPMKLGDKKVLCRYKYSHFHMALNKNISLATDFGKIHKTCVAHNISP